ncbi:MAG: hypothetical protein IJU29_00765 [Oscillospiraceae bacterium]|nr:hypothetical protein [Oscillospiraceae bacterium]
MYQSAFFRHFHHNPAHRACQVPKSTDSFVQPLQHLEKVPASVYNGFTEPGRGPFPAKRSQGDASAHVPEEQEKKEEEPALQNEVFDSDPLKCAALDYRYLRALE